MTDDPDRTEAEARVQLLCDELSLRLTEIYADELKHGPGGFDLVLERCPGGGEGFAVSQDGDRDIDTALERLFGMAITPRFGRKGPPPNAPPEQGFVARWHEALHGLIGTDGRCGLIDEGGIDDGLTLLLEGRRGFWVLRADQAHD